MDCQYTSREQWSSIRTASTPIESSGVLYGLPVHQQRVVEFYMNCQYTSREQWSSNTDCQYTSREQWSSYMDCRYTSREQCRVLYGLPVHQQRVVEFYIDCKYTIREQQSSILTVRTPIQTASTPVESTGVLYGLPVHQEKSGVLQ